MRKSVKARIVWTESNGIRKVPLVGTRYCPIIVFNSTKEQADTYWSADFVINDIDTQFASIIDLSLLSEEAPEEYLIKDEYFKLYEGNKLVAEGIIME